MGKIPKEFPNGRGHENLDALKLCEATGRLPATQYLESPKAPLSVFPQICRSGRHLPVICASLNRKTNAAENSCAYVYKCMCISVCMYVCMAITYSSVLINRVRLPILLVVSSTGRMIFFPLFPFAPENLVSRDRFGRPVPRQSTHSPHSG